MCSSDLSERYGRLQRPFLDAAQTMPAFVYLLPALALFGATRFTAIVAAIIDRRQFNQAAPQASRQDMRRRLDRLNGAEAAAWL